MKNLFFYLQKYLQNSRLYILVVDFRCLLFIPDFSTAKCQVKICLASLEK